MTAVSVIVQRSAAYLLTDTAQFHADDTIARFGRKVVSSSKLRIAVGINGTSSPEASSDLQTWLRAQPSQEAVLAGLPRRVLEMEADNMTGAWEGLDTVCQFFIAAWSRARSCALGLVVSSRAGTMGQQDAGEMRHIDRVFSPPIDRASWPEEVFLPKRQGVDILQAQRHTPRDDGVFLVGGSGVLTTVDERGVKFDTICQWPDRVGEKIVPR